MPAARWRETADAGESLQRGHRRRPMRRSFTRPSIAEGIWKSTDQGQDLDPVRPRACPTRSAIIEVAVESGQPARRLCHRTWTGTARSSIRTTAGDVDRIVAGQESDHDGQSHPARRALRSKTTRLSQPTNIAINPRNPKELFLSANWRPCLSEDGGGPGPSAIRGADISCATDIRFSGGRVYVSAMDEGTSSARTTAGHWRQLWPRKWSTESAATTGGWRINTPTRRGPHHRHLQPLEAATPTCVILSEDGGKTYHGRQRAGLPDYYPTANTMWGKGYPAPGGRPKDPNIVYLGMDGDPAGGKRAAASSSPTTRQDLEAAAQPARQPPHVLRPGG